MILNFVMMCVNLQELSTHGIKLLHILKNDGKKVSNQNQNSLQQTGETGPLSRKGDI